MNPDYTIIGEYVVQKKYIGKGTFSKIYYGYHISTKVDVAIKRIKMKNSRNLRRLITREIEVLRKLDHPNVIKLYDVIYNSNTVFLILEYCKHGDFSCFLKKRALKEERAKKFIRELAEGMKYLKKHNITHRDLKPQNLLLTDKYNLKITDFGLAKFTEDDKMMQTMCGSPLYMAPEILTYKEYTDKADLWSIGVILYEMLTGELPFKGKTIYNIMKQIENKTIKFPKNKYPISYEAEQLVNNLLQKDADKRISWNEFFSHSWLYPKDISQNIILCIQDKNSLEDNNTTDQEDDLLFDMDDDDDIVNIPQPKKEPNNSINDSCTYLFEKNLNKELKEEYFSSNSLKQSNIETTRSKPIEINNNRPTVKKILSGFIVENMSSPLLDDNKTIVKNMRKMFDSSLSKMKNSFSTFFTNSL